MTDSKVGACRHFTYLSTYMYKRSGLALEEYFPSNHFISLFLLTAYQEDKLQIPLFQVFDVARSREVPENNRHRV